VNWTITRLDFTVKRWGDRSKYVCTPNLGEVSFAVPGIAGDGFINLWTAAEISGHIHLGDLLSGPSKTRKKRIGT
jgi:hypothetical protein